MLNQEAPVADPYFLLWRWGKEVENVPKKEKGVPALDLLKYKLFHLQSSLQEKYVFSLTLVLSQIIIVYLP